MALFDLVRPQWKHSDPARRVEAMRLLEDDRQDVFLPAALEDDHADVRLAAAKRLKGEEALRRALARAEARVEDKAVREALHKALIPLVTGRANAAPRDTSAAQAEGWIGELAGWTGGEKALEDLALNAAAPAVRAAAQARLTHAAALLAATVREEDPALALAAFARLTREAHFETVAKSAKTREARQAAKDKIKALEDAKKPDAAALGRAKLNILIATAEKIEAGCDAPVHDFNWDNAREHLEESVTAFEALIAEGIHATAAERAQFAANVAAFRERHALHVASEQARRERDAEEARVRAIRDDACAGLEALYADPRPVDAAAADALIRAYQNAGAAEDEAQAGRFRVARERVSDKLRRQREAEQAARAGEHAAKDSADKAAREARSAEQQALDAAKREGARAQAAPALETLIAELEALASTADPKTADKRLRDANAQGKRLLALLGESPEDPGHGAALRFHAAVDRLRETLEWNRWSNLQRKQALIEQLEALLATVSAPSPADPENAGNPEDTRRHFLRFKEHLAEWKAVGPVPWDATEATWDRYHAAADALYEKFREYFAELDGEREANLKAKEELVAKLEGLMTALASAPAAAPDEVTHTAAADATVAQAQDAATDAAPATAPEDAAVETSAAAATSVNEAAEAFREAHAAWKAIGAVPREKADALWERFRAVNKAFQDKRDEAYKANLTAKRDLVAFVEELKDSTAWKKTGERIKQAQEKWKSIGPVPRDKSEALWKRFHAACETFFTARRAFYDQLDAERPLNLEKKTALCERMEKLDELADDRARYEAILDAQAQWKEIGQVPREQEDALWERFRKPIDAYFEAHRERTAGECALRDAGAKAKEALCVEAEALKDSTDRRAAAQFKDLQARWKDSPPAPRSLDQALWKRFRAACDAYFERLKAEVAARDGDPEENLRHKEDLCFAVEILSGRPAPDAEAKMARDAWVEAQLASGRGAPSAPESASEWMRASGKVKALQQEWRTIGAAPKAENDALWTRFRKACDEFFEEQRRALAPAEEDPQQHLEEKLALIAEAEALAARPGLANLPVVQDIQRRWKRAGAVPRAQTDYINQRFQAACDAALKAGG